MYSNVLKRAESQLDGGKKTEAEIARYILSQNITDEEAYDILTYLGLSGVLDQETRKNKVTGSASALGLLSGAGGKNTMRTY